MASSNNNVNDPFTDNQENQQGGQPTGQSTYPAPEGAPAGQGENSNSLPHLPLPHERKLSESGRLAVEKRAEARRAKAEAKYYTRKERIENVFGNNLGHPKALKKQSKLEMKHKKWLRKIDRKRNEEMVAKKVRAQHPPNYPTSAPPS